MKRIKTPINKLELVALISGFVLMVFELAGARILAPSIGSSTYVWTSVIGVIIAALSLGYFAGGKFADMRGYLIDVVRLTLLSSIFITLTIVLYKDVILWVVDAIADPRLQGVVASLILFAPASFVLGTISPYLAKLNVTSLKTTGRSVASLSALNSIGGIIGTFTAGFFLFGFIGSHETLSFVSLLMLLVSWIIRPELEWRIRLFLTIAVLVIVGFSFQRTEGLSFDTPTAHYTVTDTSTGFRQLKTGPHGAQSIVNLKDKSSLASWYTQQLDLAVTHAPQKKNILMLGGGALTLPQHLANKYPESHIDVVEIDPELASIARRYFGYKDPGNVSLIFTDARTYVNQTKKQYDIILVDVYGDMEVPFVFLTQEYGDRIKEITRPAGIVAVNMIAGMRGKCFRWLQALDAPYRAHFTSAVYLIESSDGVRSNMVVVYSRQPMTLPGVSSLDLMPGISYSDNFAPAERLQYDCEASARSRVDA